MSLTDFILTLVPVFCSLQTSTRAVRGRIEISVTCDVRFGLSFEYVDMASSDLFDIARMNRSA